MSRFGRLERTFDVRVPHLSAMLAGRRASPPPASVNYTNNMPPDFGMMLNDDLGDCTCAACYHARQVWTFNAQNNEITEPDSDVEELYEQACGYDPSQPGPGPGGNEQHVLGFWLNTGIPIGSAGTGREKITAFAEVDPRILDDVKRTIADCGVAYIGFPVPSNVTYENLVWDYDPTAQMTGEGHAVVLTGYDENVAILISWGRIYSMTWDFFSRYVDEVYAITDPSWVRTRKRPPHNILLPFWEKQMELLRQRSKEGNGVKTPTRKKEKAAR